MNKFASKFWIVILTAFSAVAQPDANTPPPSGPHYEAIRAACIAHRRCICGRVLEITKGGLIIDSGYTNLLREPFNHNWLTRASAALPRPANLVERPATDSCAVGTVFLTDIPRRQTVHQYDYVALIGYPAGDYTYAPVPGVKKTIRRFAAGLEKAVKLSMSAGEH